MTRRGFLGWLAGLWASLNVEVEGGQANSTTRSRDGMPQPPASTPCQRRVIRFGVPVQGLEGRTGSIVYRCWRES